MPNDAQIAVAILIFAFVLSAACLAYFINKELF